MDILPKDVLIPSAEAIHTVNTATKFLDEFGLQTSGGRQKWKGLKESFNANRSFKYGGKDIVLAEFSFMNA